MYLLLLVYMVFSRAHNSAVVAEPLTYLLDLSALRIGAEGTCTNDKVCAYDAQRDNLTCNDCSFSNFLPEHATDGDISTTWVSAPSFQNPSLTVDLGEVSETCFVFCFFQLE